MKLDCAGTALDLRRPVVMGVLNITPDSFSDGGSWVEADTAVRRAHEMVEQGAAIIDIGGESTRPGADPVSVQQELDRVMPVVEAVSGLDAVVSIDTRKPEVIRAAAAAGAGLINDVAALREPGAIEAAAESGCAVALMHMLGEPRTMQDDPRYDDVVRQVREFLQGRVEGCINAGIAAERLVVDPGFGFGKTLQHNYILLANLRQISALGYPLLVGMSRKSMLGGMLNVPPEERVAAGVAAAVLAAERGAAIIRTHDVRETVDALAILSAMQAESAT